MKELRTTRHRLVLRIEQNRRHQRFGVDIRLRSSNRRQNLCRLQLRWQRLQSEVDIKLCLHLWRQHNIMEVKVARLYDTLENRGWVHSLIERSQRSQDLKRVGSGGRQCGSVNNILAWRTLSARLNQDQYVHWERGRERGTKIVCSYYSKETTTQQFTRVSLYTNWLRETTLYTIYRNSLNLDYPRDNVNMTIIHSYSTLPCNGHIQGFKQEL